MQEYDLRSPLNKFTDSIYYSCKNLGTFIGSIIGAIGAFISVVLIIILCLGVIIGVAYGAYLGIIEVINYVNLSL